MRNHWRKWTEPNPPETMVTGPRISASFCRVKFFIRQRIKVLFPTFGGPTTTITIGGGSRGVRSTRGMWCFLVFMSWDLRGENTQQWGLFLLLLQISKFKKVKLLKFFDHKSMTWSIQNLVQDQCPFNLASVCLNVFWLFLWGKLKVDW